MYFLNPLLGLCTPLLFAPEMLLNCTPISGTFHLFSDHFKRDGRFVADGMRASRKQAND